MKIGLVHKNVRIHLRDLGPYRIILTVQLKTINFLGLVINREKSSINQNLITFSGMAKYCRKYDRIKADWLNYQFKCSYGICPRKILKKQKKYD